jgi:hypothetical protein
MAAGPWVFTATTRQKILNGTFVIPAGSSLKMALFTSGSNLTTASAAFSGVTSEVSNTGYAAGGLALALTQSGTTTVTVVMTTAPVWTAGTTNLTSKWAAIYVVAGDVICFALLDSGGADVTATPGNTLTVGSNGGTVMTLA